MDNLVIDQSLYFQIFSNCQIVRGAKRSVIVDLQKEEMYFIPNDVSEIICELSTKKYSTYINDFDEISISTINKYIDFLLNNGLGFWTDTPELFPPFDLAWDSPSLITNSIIDVDENSIHPWQKIVNELEDLGCRGVQIRFYHTISPNDLEDILSYFENTRISSIEIIIKYNTKYNKKYINSLLTRHLRLKSLIIHSCSFDEVYVANEGKASQGMGNVYFISQIIDSNTHCGLISSTSFSFNISSFTEANNFNSCLNKKVSIDCNGDIKNCPSLSTVYGNINTTLIKDCINNSFKELWELTKDQIKICSDCEFRYVCTDCRAFLENKFDKPAKCNYNPYTCSWEV